MTTPTKTTSKARIADAVFLLAAGSDGEPAKEIRLFKFGDNETTKGTFVLTKEGAQAVVEAFAAYGNDLVVDYEHQTMDAPANGPVPAAGWIRQGSLEVRDDGLWAKVEWTENAAKLITAKEYRYTSPTFSYEKKSMEIRELGPLALVNYPATMGQEPLIAAKATAFAGERRSVDHVALASFQDITSALWKAISNRYGYDAYILDVFDDDVVYTAEGRTWTCEYSMDGTAAVLTSEPVEVERTYVPAAPGGSGTGMPGEATGDTTMATKSLKAILGLAESTSDDAMRERVEALAAVERDLVKLTGKTTLDEALGVAQGWKGEVAKVEALSAEIESLKAEKADAEIAKLVADATAKKLTKAQIDELAEIAKLSIVRARATLSVMTPHPAVTSPTPKEPQANPTSASAVSVDGKAWEALRPVEKHKIHQTDPAMYELLKADWQRRGSPDPTYENA